MVVVNGYVYYTDTTAGSIDDIALLVEAAPKGGVNSKWEGRLIFADGTDKVVEIEKKWDDKDDGKAIAEFHEGNNENPNAQGDYWHWQLLYQGTADARFLRGIQGRLHPDPSGR